MITPSFALTATERVLPKLALDFTTASLDSRITFTRALNTATRVNSSGYIESVNADVPRFDYDPVTLSCKGLLIEESRTNLIEHSNDFTQWINANVTITANDQLSPDGTQNADKLEAAAADSALVYQVPVTSGQTYTYSIYLKAPASTAINLIVDTNAGGSIVGLPITVTTSWQRFVFSFTTTGTTANVFIGGAASFSSPEIVYAYGAQVELGAFATSYIPTSGGTATRNADVATMTGTNFSNWFDRLRGAFLAETSTMSFAANRALWAVGDPTLAFGSSETMFAIYSSSAAGAIQFNSFDGGALQASLTPAVAQTINVKTKSVFAYALNNYGASVSASAVTTGAGSLPTETAMSIGSLVSGWNGATQYLNGHIAKLFYYAPRITNAEVQAFSK